MVIAAIVQAVATVILVLVTWWYARLTKRMVDYAQQEWRRNRANAVAAVRLELSEVKQACLQSIDSQGSQSSRVEPMELPTAIWDSTRVYMEWMPPEAFRSVADAYIKVRACNGWYNRWLEVRTEGYAKQYAIDWKAMVTKCQERVEQAMNVLQQFSPGASVDGGLHASPYDSEPRGTDGNAPLRS